MIARGLSAQAQLTLSDAVDSAVRNYPSVRSSQEQIDAAAAGISTGANGLPAESGLPWPRVEIQELAASSPPRIGDIHDFPRKISLNNGSHLPLRGHTGTSLASSMSLEIDRERGPMLDFVRSRFANNYGFTRSKLLGAAVMLTLSGLMNPPQSEAQSAAAAAPKFEVASIRPAASTPNFATAGGGGNAPPPPPGGGGCIGRSTMDASRINRVCESLRALYWMRSPSFPIGFWRRIGQILSDSTADGELSNWAGNSLTPFSAINRHEWSYVM